MNLQQPKIRKAHWTASDWVQSLMSEGYLVAFISESFVKLRHVSNGNKASVSVVGDRVTLKINGREKKVCQY